jgi:hypothetical protein
MRDIQYPQFPHENFSVNDFTKPSQSPQVLKGVMYEVLENSIHPVRDYNR